MPTHDEPIHDMPAPHAPAATASASRTPASRTPTTHGPGRPGPSRGLSLLLAVAGGFATYLAFPDTGWWQLAIVGTGLLFAALRRDTPGWNALLGLAYGLTFFLPHLWWSRVATDVVPWLALSVLQAVFLAVLGAAWTWARRTRVLHRHPLVQGPAWAVLWVAVEQLRSCVPFGGFPWGKLAFSQADSPLAAYAHLAGTPAVGFAVALAGALVVLGALALLDRQLVRAGVTIGVVAAVGVGSLLVPLDTRAQSGTLRVGAVQGNVSEPGLESFANRGEVLDNHLDGTRALLRQVDPGDLDVVLWPENGSDLDPQTTPDVAAAIDDAATAVGAPILVGAQEFPETGGRYNVLLLWEPGVGVVDRYAKQHPAPFGEYIPIRGFVRHFSAEVDRITTDMLPGVGVATIDLPVDRLGRDVPLGTVICFEVAYDELIHASVRAGAEVLVVPTNNASFGMTAESTQQLAMSRLRAIETGRATVQVSTVGVSGVIAPNGALLESTDLYTAEQMVADLPLRTDLTPAVRAGAWPQRVAWALAALLVAAGFVSGIRERRRSAEA
ncbi:apolipoprotein N-acyltransferase [Sediminihabitans luteus]|uniref:Apolipoprotein N-acyltransferase n=1 Tax=Sediminihabitans luteus TaxID=1138585 RepID=A0A2M9CQU2_9CELL|nr:apolipoprotein N-acyltransferase [Sediminihabitans luteus]PJJ74257.1 apolipoprotein N-acyltransferase [Sediminihabitans luteus]GII99110.1 apolipoprotein N-acyltransferase [Sediminihabitans luteus]